MVQGGSMMLEGKNALVTGASRGIGRAIAMELAKQGSNVAVNYAGNEKKAEAVVQEIEKLGCKAIKIKTDVADEAAVKMMVKKVISEFGSLDILVNNAGITRDNLLMRMKETEFDEVINTNLKGVFLCTKAVTRQMMKQRAGKIINVASIVGISGNPGQANYVAAKAGVIGLTKTTAKELASRNILVNAVAPGFISTDMTEALSQEQQEEMLAIIPLQKLGEPEDVAKVVRFLASDDASYITGQTIHIDGGMVM
jgi:3-oxoacyl-[acyl-carrier protein] reductase